MAKKTGFCDMVVANSLRFLRTYRVIANSLKCLGPAAKKVEKTVAQEIGAAFKAHCF